MKFYPKNFLPDAEVKKFILIFYIVGTLGFLIPQTRALFISITPLALILNIYLLAIYNKEYKPKQILAFFLVFTLGFIVEVLGVQSGLIFGSYCYGDTLGFKLLDTPLLIGLNWVFVTYSCVSLAGQLSKNSYVQLVLAPTLMLAYDLVLEQVAPKINMWAWAQNAVPLKNYIAWWLIGFLFAVLFKLAAVNTRNSLALVIFGAQFVFFFILYLFLTLL